jgi:transcriptional regulator with XRE-family HTH domain
MGGRPRIDVPRVAEAPPSSLRRIFGNNVLARCKAVDISQEELAERASVHQTFLGAVGRGEVNISLSTLDQSSAVLGVELARLLIRP